METYIKKTVTNLTNEGVSVLSRRFELNESGEEVQMGENHRCAYVNSESSRELLLESEPEEIVAEVMEVWGDTPTVEEVDFPDYTPEPTQEERIAELEAQNEMLLSCVLEMSEIVYA